MPLFASHHQCISVQHTNDNQLESASCSQNILYVDKQMHHIDGLVQDCSVLAMQILQCCTEPWICHLITRKLEKGHTVARILAVKCQGIFVQNAL